MEITLEQLQTTISLDIKNRTDNLNKLLSYMYDMIKTEGNDYRFNLIGLQDATGIHKAVVRNYLLALISNDYLTIEDPVRTQDKYSYQATDNFIKGSSNSDYKRIFAIILKQHNIFLPETVMEYVYKNSSFTKYDFLKYFTENDFEWLVLHKNIFHKGDTSYKSTQLLKDITSLVNNATFNKTTFDIAYNIYKDLNNRAFTVTEKAVLEAIYADLNGIDVFNLNLVIESVKTHKSLIQDALNRFTEIGLLSFDEEENAYYKTNKMTDTFLVSQSGYKVKKDAAVIKNEIFKSVNITLTRNRIVDLMIEKIKTNQKITMEGFYNSNEFKPDQVKYLFEEMTEKGLLVKNGSEFIKGRVLCNILI